jgi:hypothetical protein
MCIVLKGGGIYKPPVVGVLHVVRAERVPQRAEQRNADGIPAVPQKSGNVQTVRLP